MQFLTVFIRSSDEKNRSILLNLVYFSIRLPG